MMDRTLITITLIEDNPDDAGHIQELLRESSRVHYVVAVHKTLAEGIASIPETAPDIILTDLGLPDSQGLSTLIALRQQSPHIPIIVLTGHDDEEMGTVAVSEGAQDYIVKGVSQAGSIKRAIRYAIEHHRMENELLQHRDHLETLVNEHAATNEQLQREIRERKRIEQALQRERKFLEQVVKSSPNPFFAKSVDGHFVVVNQKAAELFNTTVEELVGKTTVRLVSENPDLEMLLDDKRVIQTGESVSLSDFEIPSDDATTMYFQVMKIPLFDNTSNIQGVLTIATDITALKQAEIANQEQRIATEILRETILSMITSLDPDQVMEKILENIEKLVPHDAANIMLIEGDVARIRYSRGYDPESDAVIREHAFSLELTNLRDMIVRGVPYYNNDVQASSDWKSMGINPWLRAYLGVPIKVLGETVGILNIDSATPGFFTETHARNLQLFADQAAIAIHNAQLHEALHHNIDEMHRLQQASNLLFTSFSSAQSMKELAVEIAHAIVQTFNFVDAGILLLDQDDHHLIRLGRAGKYSKYETDEFMPLHLDGPGLAARAIKRGKIVYAPDVTQEPDYVASIAETRSELVIPLRTSKGIIGVLDLQSPEPDGFGDYLQETLAAFAERAATVIENMQLYDRVRKYADELELRVRERTVELREAKAHVEATFESINDPIIFINSDHQITYSNPVFCSDFGYEADERFQLSVDRIFVEAANIKQAIEQAIDTAKPCRLETVARRKDGSTFMAEVTFAPIIEDPENGREIDENLVCSIHDISYYKEIEQMKNDFVTMVSHELRTPITSLILNTNNLLKYRDRLSEEQKIKRINRLYQQSHILAGLVEDILEIARLETRMQRRELNHTEMGQIITNVVDDLRKLAKEKNQTLTLEIAETPLILECDISDMKIIWTNLIENAIKYTPDGGEIWIRAAKLSNINDDLKVSDDIIVTDLPPASKLMKHNYIIGQVEDTGFGIDSNEIEHIFERFNRSWAASSAIPGTGLGLAMVNESLALYDGGIRVSSNKNEGSIFTFWIPTGVDSDGQGSRG